MLGDYDGIHRLFLPHSSSLVSAEMSHDSQLCKTIVSLPLNHPTHITNTAIVRSSEKLYGNESNICSTHKISILLSKFHKLNEHIKGLRLSLDTFLKQTQSFSPLENDACCLLLLDFDLIIETKWKSKKHHFCR